MKNDILSKEDIKSLVDTFYQKVKGDELLGFLFTGTNWDKHLGVMYQFWENAILYTGDYHGNPMKMHQQLHHYANLTQQQFNRWTELFIETIDEMFIGERADAAKQRASNLSIVIQERIFNCEGQSNNATAQ